MDLYIYIFLFFGGGGGERWIGRITFFYVVFGMVWTFDAATTNRTPQQQLEGNQL